MSHYLSDTDRRYGKARGEGMKCRIAVVTWLPPLAPPAAPPAGRSASGSASRGRRLHQPPAAEGDAAQDHRARAFFFVAVGHLERDCKELGSLGLIARWSPMEGGQLGAALSEIVAGFTGAEKAMDVFRSVSGKPQSYPYIMTVIARVVTIIYCVCCSVVIGCKTAHVSQLDTFPYLGVAEVLSFVISISFSTIFFIATQMENPYGDDLTDFSLKRFGDALDLDLQAILEVPSWREPGPTGPVVPPSPRTATWTPPRAARAQLEAR